MALYGGQLLYIPFERTAFENIIAEEIYQRSMNEGTGVMEMFRDYGICFTKAYRLWKKGRKIKLHKEMKK
ncbi:MAG: hypothetical protein LBH43_03690 [Treponema sp.]|jgi:Mor family transcriptional regulator|nr:hypothetical protein [Treponema sp.]